MLPRNQNHKVVEISDLTAEERDALTGAAGWYANYHAGIIANRADDRSAYAVVERERFCDLISALRKLGIPIPPADVMLDERVERAA